MTSHDYCTKKNKICNESCLCKSCYIFSIKKPLDLIIGYCGNESYEKYSDYPASCVPVPACGLYKDWINGITKGKINGEYKGM